MYCHGCVLIFDKSRVSMLISLTDCTMEFQVAFLTRWLNLGIDFHGHISFFLIHVCSADV